MKWLNIQEILPPIDTIILMYIPSFEFVFAKFWIDETEEDDIEYSGSFELILSQLDGNCCQTCTDVDLWMKKGVMFFTNAYSEKIDLACMVYWKELKIPE